ncbi:MAG: hypothetical protein H0V82_04895 [Candidatus Protochlamydia sp.]|nr:hypothetical protein [Candidatus Protochlamydia sp.]
MIYYSVRSYLLCTSIGMAMTAFAALTGAPADYSTYQTTNTANPQAPQQTQTPVRSNRYQNTPTNYPASRLPLPTQPNRYGEREAIAFRDNDDKSLSNRNLNRGNWDNREGWRYDKQAFYSGENQNQAYDQEFPGMRGIGYDAYDPYFYTQGNGGYPGSYNDPNAGYSSYSTTGVNPNSPNGRYTGYNTYPSVERENFMNPNSGTNFDSYRGGRRR